MSSLALSQDSNALPTVTLDRLEATEFLGQQLAKNLLELRASKGAIGTESFRLYLQGDLGAGKTSLSRALIHALGVAGTIKSPTFTLVETYDTDQGQVAHFDFYRFNDPQEWMDAGFDEVFVRSWLVIAEWPEMAQGILPPADLLLCLQISEDTLSRSAQFEAGSPLGLTLINQICKSFESWKAE